ncbi:hypothetical protein [Christiangramia crocea]|uniref:Uncharacterized protein n=1 Tax=Christiangramia crocea TaxID=2904124 RepID=A0A9X1UVA1_9FLAO|nr:hypothetical protein [Gramella crocea]MCG9971037.1 hypothetical protein [Gramella crocea]
MRNFSNPSTETAQSFPQEAKIKDEVLDTYKKVISSVLVALSGLVLFSDKVITFSLDKLCALRDQELLYIIPTIPYRFLEFIMVDLAAKNYYGWNMEFLVFLTAIPIGLIMYGIAASIAKPYTVANIIPVWVGSVFMIFLYQPDIPSDRVYTHYYVLGIIIGFIIITSIFQLALKKAYFIRNRKINALKQALDLDLAPVVRELFDFIILYTQKEYIALLSRRMQMQYKEAYLLLIEKFGIKL